MANAQGIDLKRMLGADCLIIVSGTLLYDIVEELISAAH